MFFLFHLASMFSHCVDKMWGFVSLYFPQVYLILFFCDFLFHLVSEFQMNRYYFSVLVMPVTYFVTENVKLVWQNLLFIRRWGLPCIILWSDRKKQAHWWIIPAPMQSAKWHGNMGLRVIVQNDSSCLNYLCDFAKSLNFSNPNFP